MSAVTADAIREAIAAEPRLAQHITDIRISARRKTLGLAMSPGDSGITVHVPATATPDEVVHLLAKNRDRIGAMLLKAHQHAPDHPVKELVNGSGFLWFGYSSRLRLVDNPGEPVRLVDDQGCVGQPASWRGRWFELDRAAARQGAKPLIDWYTRQGTIWLQQEAARLWSGMTIRQPMPTVRAADIGRTRWGVHDGVKDEIRIAWQTFQFPHRLIRHVLGHELIHATQPGGHPHGPEFWRAFERAMPGARQVKRELDEAGRHVWMGDIA